MATALYDESTGTFNRSAIMRRAWDETKANRIYATTDAETRRRIFGATLSRIWLLANGEKFQAEYRANAVIVLAEQAAARATETDAQRLYREINALGCDTFRRAA